MQSENAAGDARPSGRGGGSPAPRSADVTERYPVRPPRQAPAAPPTRVPPVRPAAPLKPLRPLGQVRMPPRGPGLQRAGPPVVAGAGSRPAAGQLQRAAQQRHLEAWKGRAVAIAVAAFAGFWALALGHPVGTAAQAAGTPQSQQPAGAAATPASPGATQQPTQDPNQNSFFGGGLPGGLGNGSGGGFFSSGSS